MNKNYIYFQEYNDSFCKQKVVAKLLLDYFIIRILLKMTFIKDILSMNLGNLVNNVVKLDENNLRDSDIKT